MSEENTKQTTANLKVKTGNYLRPVASRCLFVCETKRAHDQFSLCSTNSEGAMKIPIFQELRLYVCLFVVYTTLYDLAKLDVCLFVKMFCNRTRRIPDTQGSLEGVAKAKSRLEDLKYLSLIGGFWSVVSMDLFSVSCYLTGKQHAVQQDKWKQK